MHIFSLQPQIETFLKSQTGILAAIRIGSAGRQQLRPNSDLDYQLILAGNHRPEDILQKAKETFGLSLRYVLPDFKTGKATLYFDNHLLQCEFFFHQRKEQLAPYFLHSEVSNAYQAIVFDSSGELAPYLQYLIEGWVENREERLANEVKRLVEAFEIRFEGCSRAHGRSDGYRFSVLFGHALNAVVRLVWLARGERQFDFMPANFLTKYSHPMGLGLDRLGLIDLSTAHSQKNHLLGLFAEWGPKAASQFGLEMDWQGKLDFLNAVMGRDRFWNLRDASRFNTGLRHGHVFRSAAFCLMHPSEDVCSFLKQENIHAIIDLRACRELEEHPYSPEQLNGVKYIHAPFDPWKQPEHFKKEHAHLTDNSVIAYYFFLKCCQESVCKVFAALVETESAVLIHCHAGKDRTGIILTLLHLLCGADEHTARIDYLASEMDTRPELFDLIVEVVEEKGGVVPYLKGCGVPDFQIHQIKSRLCLSQMN